MQEENNSIIGLKFNYLTVIQIVPRIKGAHNVIVECQCDCGKILTTRKSRVIQSDIKSCGCKNNYCTPENIGTYKIYIGMKSRCSNPNNTAYKHYGGRGIKVCDRWLGKDGFKNFVADMGLRPGKKEIDRYPNSNGNYEPSNCRWATRYEQLNNTCRIRRITHNGETKTISEWERDLNYKPNELHHRLMAYTFEESISILSTWGKNLPRKRLFPKKQKLQV
jgi:hypothetical protein